MMMWQVTIMAAMVMSQALATSYFPPAMQALGVILTKIEAEFCTSQPITPKSVSPEEASSYIELAHLYGQVPQGRATCRDVAGLATILLERPEFDQAARARLNEIRRDVQKVCCSPEGRLLAVPKTQADQISRETSSQRALSSNNVDKLDETLAGLVDARMVRMSGVAQQLGPKRALSLLDPSPIAAIHARIEEEFWSVQDYPEPMFAYSEECSKFVHLGHLTGKGLGQGRRFCSDATRMVERLWDRPGLDQAALARMNGIRNDLWEICWPGKVPGRMSYGPKTRADQISRETSSEPTANSKILGVVKMVASLLYGRDAAEEISKISEKLNHVVRLEDVVQEPGVGAAEDETSYRSAEGRLLTEPEPKTQADHKTSSEAALSSTNAEEINKMTAFESAVFERSDLDDVETFIHDTVEAHTAAAEREFISRHDTLCAPYMRPSCLLDGPDSHDDPMRWYEPPAMVAMVLVIFIFILCVFTKIALTKLLEFVWAEPFLSALLVILGTCSIVLLKLMWEDMEKPEVLVESKAAEAEADDEESDDYDQYSDEDDEESDEDDDQSAADVLPEEEATVPFFSHGKCKHIKTETPEQSVPLLSAEIITLNSQLQKCHQEFKKRDASNYHLQYLLKETVIEKTGYRKELEEAKASISTLITQKKWLYDERQKALDKVKELEKGQDLAKDGWVKLDQIQFLHGVDPDEAGVIVDLPNTGDFV